MAERTQFPSSPACGAWETLLADALDGLLKPEDEAQFTAHKAGCPACAALYEEARKGREWLEFLSPEPEVPEGLLERILAQTGPGHSAGRAASMPVPALAGSRRFRHLCRRCGSSRDSWPGTRQAVQPRLLMTAAMAFFSIALTLNLTGVRLSTLAAGRSAAGCGAVVHGAAVEHGFGADRSLLRPSCGLCTRWNRGCGNCAARAMARKTRRREATRIRKQGQPATPGETKQNPGKNDGGGRLDPRQRAGQFSGTAGVRRHE